MKISELMTITKATDTHGHVSRTKAERITDPHGYFAHPLQIDEEDEPHLPSTVYHVSRSRNRLSIRQRGLVPKIKEFDHIMRTPGIFCFETLDQAKDWAYYWAMDEREPMDIWAVKLVDPETQLHADPAEDMQETYDAWVIYQPIPSAQIYRVHSQPIPSGWAGSPQQFTKVRNLEED